MENTPLTLKHNAFSRKIAAFTLVELLVVITIIATLASISFPVYNAVKERGKQVKALTHAKQIALACVMFAGDYDGAFPRYVDPEAEEPVDAQNANDLFQSLITGGYMPNEELFYVQGSGWSSATLKNDQTLKPGENNFAYFLGLQDTDPPNWPLIADGWKEGGADGVYTNQPREPGGVWKGKKAIVIRLDQSGRLETLNKNHEPLGDVQTAEGTSSRKNILQINGDWLAGTKALLPVKQASASASE